MSAHDLVVLVMLSGLLALSMHVAGLRSIQHRLGREAARKAVHALMGMAAASLPLWFDSMVPVLATSGVMVAWLLAVRGVPALDQRFGATLRAPGRSSVGDLAFALAVPAAFGCSGGVLVSYSASLLLLAGADAAAALVGRRSRGPRYVGLGCGKSPAGTGAFLVVGIAIVATVLFALGGSSPGRALVASIPVVLVAACLELCSPRGLDNLSIPLSAAALLTPGWCAELAGLFGGLAGVVVAGAMLRARTSGRRAAWRVQEGMA